MKTLYTMQLLVLAWLSMVISGQAQSQNISFTADVERGCAPLTINFTNTSTVGESYKWEICNGTFDIIDVKYGRDLTYAFAYPTYFHIVLRAYDSSGNAIPGVGSGSVFVYGQYELGLLTDSVCPGDIVYMSCSGTRDALLWQFGDGKSADGINKYWISHSYEVAGEYYPRAIIVNMCGRDTLTFSTPVVVTNSIPAETPYFNVSAANICPSTSVCFSYYTNSEFTSFEWDLGDGTIVTTQNMEVFHHYSTVGSYTVKVTGTNRCGNKNSFSRIVIVSENHLSSAPKIYCTDKVTCLGSTISFGTDWNSQYEIQSYRWDFGDGASDTARNSAHAYADTGTYIVKLTVTNFCANSNFSLDTVSIANTNQPMYLPNIRLYPNPACPGDTIFIGNNPYSFFTGNGVSFSWDFGDGNSDTNGVSSHIYKSPGTYLVVRTATNACGNSISDSVTIIINDSIIPPAPFFRIAPPDACPGDVVVLGNIKYLDNPYDYKNLLFIWDYDDGAIDTTFSIFAKHKYSNSGDYKVTLTALNRCGNKNSFTDTVMIANDNNVNRFASFDWKQFQDETLRPCQQIIFRALGGYNGSENEGYRYEWDWGDGTILIADSTQVHHTYLKEDIYLVKVTATNGCGISKSYSRYIVIAGECINAGDRSVTSPQPIGQSIVVYPNPMEKKASVQIPSFFERENAKLKIYDLFGRAVLQYVLQNQNPEIDLSSQPPGIYFLTVQTKDKVFSEKIIKQ